MDLEALRREYLKDGLERENLASFEFKAQRFRDARKPQLRHFPETAHLVTRRNWWRLCSISRSRASILENRRPDEFIYKFNGI